MPTVASLDPADNAKFIWRNRPVLLNLTKSDSNDLKVLETLTADFEAGTLTDVLATNNALTLLNQRLETFEDDTVGQEPAGWTYSGNHATHGVYDDSGNKVYRIVNGGTTTGGVLTWDAAGSYQNWVVQGKFKVASKVNGQIVWLMCRRYWSPGSYSYELMLVPDNDTITMHKTVNGVSTNLNTYSFAWSANTWYTMKFSVQGNRLRGKIWLSSGSEPSSWQIDQTDNDVTQAGTFAVGEFYTTGANTYYFDDVRVFGQGTSYPTSGNRISENHSLATVAKVGGTWVEWNADVPADTTLAMEASINGGTNWYTLTNGAPIPTILQEDFDCSTTNLIVRCSMTGTGSNTPTLYDMTITFRPVEPRSVEVIVNGESCTLANGLLDHWKTQIKSGSAIVDCYKNVYFATLKPWWDYCKATPTVLVKYKGTTISTTDFDTEEFEAYRDVAGVYWMAKALSGVFDGPMGMYAHYFVTTIEPWLVRGETHYLITSAVRSSMDGLYWVAHPFYADNAEAMIVGQGNNFDYPESHVVKGWDRGDIPDSVIIQGWMRGDNPEGVVVGIPLLRDMAMESLIVGRLAVGDTPEAAVAYAVNRYNALEIRVLTVEEAALLAELGILVT